MQIGDRGCQCMKCQSYQINYCSTGEEDWYECEVCHATGDKYDFTCTTLEFTIDPNLPEVTPMVLAILAFKVPNLCTNIDLDVVQEAVDMFDSFGPYSTAKLLGLLKDNSAEDMAIEFMSFVNKAFHKSYY